MVWQADLPCKDKPVIVEARYRGLYLECVGHWVRPSGRDVKRHRAKIYWKKEEKNMLTDDWGFLIPSPSDEPEDFETGKLVCSNCGCYVHKDKRESHREKCNYV